MPSFICLCLVILVAFVQLGTAANYLVNKFDDVQSCQLSDTEFTKCSTKSVEQLIAKVIKGIDGLEGLPNVDPMRINKIRIFQGTGPVSINASLTKVIITGFKHHKVLESHVSKKDFSWETKIFLPKMRLEGVYDVKGRILIIPINGRGKMWIESKNMTIIMYTKTKLYEKEGHIFYNVTHSRIDYDIVGLRLRLDNLFDGIKALEESTNIYLNENWRPASEALKPVITKTIEGVLLGIMKKVFDFIPADYIVTDIPKPSEIYG